MLPGGMKTAMTQREIDERGNEELLEKELELLPMSRLEYPGSDRDDSASPYSVDTNPRQLSHWLRGPAEETKAPAARAVSPRKVRRSIPLMINTSRDYWNVKRVGWPSGHLLSSAFNVSTLASPVGTLLVQY